jgi:hypothetical protein
VNFGNKAPDGRCIKVLWANEGKFLVTESEFGGSFDMSLEGDCREIEVTPDVELLVIFVITHNFTSSYLIWR